LEIEENPFLNNEEKENDEYYEIRKPHKKEELTESQKKRNFKGLEMMKEAIKKAIPFRANR